MNYERLYGELIERAQRRDRPLVFTEVHHIQPRALGGSDDPENLVSLTYREHFLAHWLLAKITSGRDRSLMAYALHCITMALPGRKVVGWQFDVAKRALRVDYLRRAKVRVEGRRLAWKEYLLQVRAESEQAISQLAGLKLANGRDRGSIKELANQYLLSDPDRLSRRRGRSRAANERANRLYAEAQAVLKFRR
jgi:hypothetical protein